ncbi:MAG: fasciclin domain-containing protein [Blastomonas sp.]
MGRSWHLTGGAALALLLSACGSEDGGGDPVPGYDENATDESLAAPLVEEAEITANIADVANANPDLTMVVAAFKAAGLAGELTAKGPVTVFAPTNLAFEKKGMTSTAAFEEPDIASGLAALLNFHVVKGMLKTDDLEKLVVDNGSATRLETLSGKVLEVRQENGDLVLVDASGQPVGLAIADIEASNGVVHLVETVLEPGE